MHVFEAHEKKEHILLLYASRFERALILSDYITRSLENKNRLLTIIDSRSSTMLDYLIDYLDPAVMPDYLTNIPIEEYLWEKAPDKDDLFELIKQEIKKTEENGFKHLNVIIDMTFLTAYAPEKEQLIEFEEKLDHIYSNYPASGICVYFYETFSPDWIREISELHTKTVISDSLVFKPSNNGQKQSAFEACELDEVLKTVLFTHFYMQNRREHQNQITTYSEYSTRHPSLPPSPRFLEVNNDVIWILNNRNEIKYLSPSAEQILGLTPLTVIDKKMHTVFDSNTEKAFISLAETNGPVGMPFRINHLVHVSTTCAKEVDTLFTPVVVEGSVAGYIAASRDLSRSCISVRQGENGKEITSGPDSKSLTSSENGDDAATGNGPRKVLKGVTISQERLQKSGFFQILEESKHEIPKSKGKDEKVITNREFEIIQHLMEGMQNKEIADKINVAEITVKKHLSSIYRKLNVRNRVELVKTFRGRV
jgi:DNA-binding CsgD family transcriptional regulator/PAS domain-containing protein